MKISFFSTAVWTVLGFGLAVSAVPYPQEQAPTSTAVAFPSGVTCGCWNDCTLYGCGDDIPPEECVCAQFCDPKYECPAETETVEERSPATPTVTLPPGFTCGCTNDCKLNCPDGSCICPEYCDPKYECPATSTKVEERAPASPTFTCGCTNDCELNCKTDDCVCPKFCDPKYLCQA